MPKTFEHLFALTIVVEERAQRRYLAHAASPSVDPETAARQERHIAIPTRDSHWGIYALVRMAGRRAQHPPAHLARAAVRRRGDAAARVFDLLGQYGHSVLAAFAVTHDYVIVGEVTTW